LFSNYHLDEHLPETEAWDEVDEDELQAAYDDIKQLWGRVKGTAPKLNESQLEEKFIRPMFRKLGIPFEVEESTEGTQRRPDYGFFRTEEDGVDAFQRREEGGDFYKNAVAVADAKRWGRKLDTRGKKKRDYENPSHQIDQYLRFTSTTWGVLTNGQKWRLYYKPTSHRLDSYYEIDLPTVLEQGDLDDFKYFYLFFRHNAFVPDASGDAFLDDVYEESNVFAQELGEDLQDNIYEAIKLLSEGYLQYPENDLDEENLELIHDSSLIYLYRIIFVLYAEAEGRDLLDTNNEIYESQYSLNQLKQEVADELESGDPKYRDWQSNLQSRLDELFMLIDQGSKSRGIPKEDLYIPAYNGGLFRTNPDESGSEEARFLANNTVGDEHLARVIELLTRSKSSNGGGKIFVDYSSLDVRHLGSIYEGLLEYQLNVADEPLALTDGEYVVADESSDVVVERDDVYLTTDSGERKSTGSYYTPEYVVEYIVEETLSGPVDNIRKEVVMDERFQDGGYAEEFAERVFDLNILDPAMGSGHFLTSVVDYLARAIITEQNREAEDKDGDVIDDEHDINWARRKVAQRCIYGVDINPLATELAKVSLWLRTLAAEQPLAFLDHHLKTGNSLVGSDIEDVLSDGDAEATADGQLTLEQSFDHTRQRAMEHVTDRFQDLLNIDNETLEDAKEMEAVYDDVRNDSLYKKLLAMANVYTADAFGLGIPSDADERMANALHSDAWEKIEQQDWFKSAQAMAEDERFFHWELEFPIAFYDQDGERKSDAGFDAVIGNPPYVPIQNLPESGTSYYKKGYQTASGNYDLYVLFIEKGLDLINETSRFGFIIPNKIFQVDYGEPLRDLLSRNKQVAGAVDFGSNQVFAEAATTYTTLLFLQGNEREEPFTYWELRDNSDPASIIDIESSDKWLKNTFSNDDLSESIWGFHPREITSIIDKSESQSVILGELAAGISRGTSSGRDKVFELEAKNESDGILTCESQTSSELVEIETDVLRKPIHSTDFEKYAFTGSANKRLIWPYNKEYNLLSESEFQSNYPKAWDYLSDNRESLEDRADFLEWYGYSAARNLEIHDSAEILIPLLANGPSFSKYPKPQSDYILMASGGFSISLETNSKYSRGYILALINSNLLYLCLKSISNVFRGGYITCTKQYFEQLPIRVIEFSTPGPVREQKVQKIIEIHNNPKKSDKDVLKQIEECLEGNERHEDVVHDVLTHLTDVTSNSRNQIKDLNLSLLDHLGSYSDGPTLADMGLTQPPRGLADSILQQTATEKPNLRVGEVSVVRETDSTVEIRLTARYKPGEQDDLDEDNFETDQWGYTETGPQPALRITDLTETEANLIEAFVPVAVDKAGGFADFRGTATKTNSLVDRLRKLTLPALSDVEAGLDSYTQTKERSEELKEKIERTDELIDEIVYELYDLTDEEIEIVESAVADD